MKERIAWRDDIRGIVRASCANIAEPLVSHNLVEGMRKNMTGKLIEDRWH
jgi:hypothetical protein